MFYFITLWQSINLLNLNMLNAAQNLLNYFEFSVFIIQQGNSQGPPGAILSIALSRLQVHPSIQDLAIFYLTEPHPNYLPISMAKVKETRSSMNSG